MVTVPLGFRFSPTDKELISEYLLGKALGFQLPCNHILEKNLYGENANPWDVFSDVDEAYWDKQTVVNHVEKDGKKKVKKSVYVFTKLTRVNGKSRVSRIAGCGTWKGQSTGKIIKSEESGEEIGEMKTFTYMPNNKESKIDNWIMHEYSLSGTNELNNNEYVLCKISRESDHKKRSSAEIEKDHNKKQKTIEDCEPVLTLEEMGLFYYFDFSDILTPPPQQISDNVLNNTSENDYGQECGYLRNLDHQPTNGDGISNIPLLPSPDGILMTSEQNPIKLEY